MSSSMNSTTPTKPPTKRLTTPERHHELRQWASSHASAKRQTRSIGKDLLHIECNLLKPDNPPPEVRHRIGVFQDIREGVSESFGEYSASVAKKLGLDIDELEEAARGVRILDEVNAEEKSGKGGILVKGRKPLWVWELGGMGADRDPNSPKHDPEQWRVPKRD